MQIRLIGDEVLSRLEDEDVAHEIPGDVLESLDTNRRREFDALALEGTFAENWITDARSPSRHNDDDAIIVIDFQQLLGFGPAIGSTRGFVFGRGNATRYADCAGAGCSVARSG